MIKETTVYRSTYLVITCPYDECQTTTYFDEEDDYGEGRIGPEGRRMKCPKCGKMMRVMEGVA